MTKTQNNTPKPISFDAAVKILDNAYAVVHTEKGEICYPNVDEHPDNDAVLLIHPESYDTEYEFTGKDSYAIRNVAGADVLFVNGEQFTILVTQNKFKS